jgi:hypothetical protein
MLWSYRKIKTCIVSITSSFQRMRGCPSSQGQNRLMKCSQGQNRLMKWSQGQNRLMK